MQHSRHMNEPLSGLVARSAESMRCPDRWGRYAGLGVVDRVTSVNMGVGCQALERIPGDGAGGEP